MTNDDAIQPHRIETEEEYRYAMGRIEELIQIPELDAEAAGELDAWAVYVEDYEERHLPLGAD